MEFGTLREKKKVNLIKYALGLQEMKRADENRRARLKLDPIYLPLLGSVWLRVSSSSDWRLAKGEEKVPEGMVWGRIRSL